MRIVERLYACGHPNVLAKHRTTFEITKDWHLTKRGDCVLAVRATKGLAGLSNGFKQLCKNPDTRITFELRTGKKSDTIVGRGSSELTFNDSREMVGRKSTYISDRTLMVRADKAARDVDRDIIHALRSSNAVVQIRIIAEL